MGYLSPPPYFRFHGSPASRTSEGDLQCPQHGSLKTTHWWWDCEVKPDPLQCQWLLGRLHHRDCASAVGTQDEVVRRGHDEGTPTRICVDLGAALGPGRS